MLDAETQQRLDSLEATVRAIANGLNTNVLDALARGGSRSQVLVDNSAGNDPPNYAWRDITAEFDDAGAVLQTDFDAQSILAAINDNDPQPNVANTNNLFGRGSGDIGFLSAAQSRTVLNVADGSQPGTLTTIDDVVGQVGDQDIVTLKFNTGMFTLNESVDTQVDVTLNTVGTGAKVVSGNSVTGTSATAVMSDSPSILTPTLTNPRLSGGIYDTNTTPALWLSVGTKLSPVNYLELTGAQDGEDIRLSALGTSGTVDIGLYPKGAAGVVNVNGDAVLPVDRLTADATPTGSSDYVLAHKAGVGHRKVLMDNLPGGTLLSDPTDGSWTDGLFAWVSDTTKTMDALDDINETLADLAPAQPLSLAGASLVQSGAVVYAVGAKASAGTGQYFKSAAGEDIDGTYTGGGLILGTTFSLTEPTTGAAESGGDDAFSNGDEGTLSCRITKEGVEAERGSLDLTATTPPQTNLALTIDEQNAGYNGFTKWVRGGATIDSTGEIGQGYNKLMMRHNVSGNRDSEDYEVFYDNSVTVVSFSTGAQLSENTKVSAYLSGIEHYGDNSTFDLTFTAANAFKNCYQEDAFTTSGIAAIPNGTIALTNAAWDGSVSNPPDISDTAVLGGTTPYTVTASTNNVTDVNARLTVTAKKPGRINVTSQTQGLGGSGSLLIHTYSATGTSDDKNEYFNDENYRLPDNDGSAYPDNYDSVPGAITGQWTSSSDLNNGEAQVYNGRLYFPTINFSTGYHPSVGQPNYSTFTGDQLYLRAFRDTGTPHSSGSLELANLTGADVGAKGSGNVNVEIKLPTQTGWLDLGTDFDSGTFTGADGDGCRTSQSGDDWAWTAGTFSTADSGDMIIVRITLRNSTDNITQVRELGW